MGLLVAGAALIVLGTRLEQGTGATELRVLLAVVGAGVGLTTAPVVTAALAAAGEARAGLAAAGINVARELGGVVAVAGLGALAVSRLSSRLAAALASSGVAPDKRPPIVDALLGGRTQEVRRQLVEQLGVVRTLRVGDAVTTAARASFVSSTGVILVVAGALLLAAAAASAWQLRRA